MRDHLFTVAPHAPFLPMLVDRVLDGTLTGDWDRTGPFWLSDITIILPTRRARLALVAPLAQCVEAAHRIADFATKAAARG